MASVEQTGAANGVNRSSSSSSSSGGGGGGGTSSCSIP